MVRNVLAEHIAVVIIVEVALTNKIHFLTEIRQFSDLLHIKRIKLPRIDKLKFFNFLKFLRRDRAYPFRIKNKQQQNENIGEQYY